MLQNKSLTELRGIAQAMDVADVFQKDKTQLVQAIELRQAEVVPKPKVEVVKPAYDARLMTEVPGKIADIDEAVAALKPYVKAGLYMTWDDERWYFSRGKKTDEGTWRMPLRTILKCAEAVLA